MREPLRFDELTNWRLDCRAEAEELLEDRTTRMEQSHGQNAGGYL